MNTPVLLIIFNRFDTTLQVINSLRSARVKELYIYSDGPRMHKEGEAAQLTEVQQQVLSAINWDCSVKTNFRKDNEGPRLAIGHAVSWFFEHVEEGIILEHDCVPAQSFYKFCETLLEYYRWDESVMHISGDNFQFGKKWGDASYYFSRITHIWGWATWKRAWKHYDVDLKEFPQFIKEKKYKQISHYTKVQRYWCDILKKCYEVKVDSWDYQWNFVLFMHHGVSVLPNVNLVSNVGFDSLALNTKNPNDKTARMKVEEIEAIIHPVSKHVEEDADFETIKNVVKISKTKFVVRKLLGIFKKDT